jgi:hypothetical protein
MEGDQRQSVEYWILEPPYEVPRKVAEVDGDLYTSLAVWSHSGDKIAYVKIENGQMILVTVNVNTLESESFPIPANQPQPDVPYIYWSYDDRWLAIQYKMEDNFDIDRTIIVDTNTRESRLFENGAEFCEWFRYPTDQFLFLQKDIGTPSPSPEDSLVGEISIHVKRVADDTPSLVINQMLKYTTWVPYCNLTLSPDGKIAIVVGSDGVISKFDLVNGSWEKLPGQIKGERPYPWLWWSPEGRWILVSTGGKDLFFWDFYQDQPTSQIPLPVNNYLGAVEWTGDSEWVVYEDEKGFYAFNPNDQQRLKIFDSPRVAEWTSFSLWVE